MQIIFLGVHYQINNLEITDLIRFAHANPASLRTQENNFGSKYVKIFQDYFANVRPQESNVHGGGSSLEHICTSNPRKKMPHDYLRGYGSLHDSKRLGTRI